jgi:hypothetical protein
MSRVVIRVRFVAVTFFLMMFLAGSIPAQEKPTPGKAAKTPEEAVQLVVEACRSNDLAGVLAQTPEPLRSLQLQKMKRMRETHAALSEMIQAIGRKMKSEDADLAATTLGDTMFYLDLDTWGKIWMDPIQAGKVEKSECEGTTCRLSVIQVKKMTEIRSQTAIPPGSGEAKTQTEEQIVNKESKMEVIAIREAGGWKVYPLEQWEAFKKDEAATRSYEAEVDRSLLRLKTVAERLTPEITAGKYRSWKEIQAVIEAAIAPQNPPSP